jgi:hypothetical protein
VRTVPAIPARFKFVLDRAEVSRFPGYASNAVVSDAFLENAGLGHLKGKYANDDPDLIFDENDFADRARWAVVTPDEVETAAEDTAAAITVTAMDYGAIGKLRAYVKVKCGGWQPVRIRFNGQDRNAVSIPMDEDGNLIADSLTDYLGDPGADVDADPVGKGFAGDGLTTFEEYRGFATAGGDCSSPGDDVVVRTDPRRKDLFIYAPDPELAATLPQFEWSSGLAVHLICERHFIDQKERIVNSTLQKAGLRQWLGKTISDETPQHGLFINNEWYDGLWGIGVTCEDYPACKKTDLGPPKYTAVILMDKPRLLAEGILKLIHTVTHETGHAVGMPHHANAVDNWRIADGPSNLYADRLGAAGIDKMVVAPGEGCSDPRLTGGPGADAPTYLGETFVGCATTQIIVRRAQNSGNAECPMRYSSGSFYVAPGSAAVQDALAQVDRMGSPPVSINGSVWVVPFSGRLLKSDDSEDVATIGRFCTSQKGTALNDSARGDRSIAGDATSGNCAGMIVIKDSRAPDR